MSKRLCQLIVRLKAIKSRENIYCYLSFYLCSLELNPLLSCYYYYYPELLTYLQIIESSTLWVVVKEDHQIVFKLQAIKWWSAQVVINQIRANANFYLIGILCWYQWRNQLSSRLSSSPMSDELMIHQNV